jgi:hypothetical protein
MLLIPLIIGVTFAHIIVVDFKKPSTGYTDAFKEWNT